jgi:hypothetical protein
LVECFVCSADPDDPEAVHNTSVLSVYSDEGLDLSQHFAESLFSGPDLDGDTEEMISGERLFMPYIFENI